MSSEKETNAPRLMSCGFLIMSRKPQQFLLMKHKDRWDLPKGHVDPGETELQCAYRELEEETGIDSDIVERDSNFRYQISYPVQGKRTKGEVWQKDLVIFLGWVDEPIEINVTEHLAAEWFPWDPPHSIQAMTIDALLAAAESHLDDAL